MQRLQGTGRLTGRTIWHFTMSLDGFLADRDGSLAWLPADAGPVPMGTGLVPGIGAVLAGRHSYDLGLSEEPHRPYGGEYTGPVLVLTHRDPPARDDAGIRFVTGTLPDALREVRAVAGGRDVVVFGANVGQQCLRAGELDELVVHVAPVLLGAGIPAFAAGDDGPIGFDALERSGPNEMTSLRLAPRNRRRS